MSSVQKASPAHGKDIFGRLSSKYLEHCGDGRGWEVKILVGNLAECRTTLLSVHFNQWMRRETWTIDQCDHLSTIHQHGQAIFCFAIPTIHQVLYLSMANAGKLFNSAIILILLGTAILPLGTTQGFIKLAHESVNYYLYCTVLYCTVLYCMTMKTLLQCTLFYVLTVDKVFFWDPAYF